MSSELSCAGILWLTLSTLAALGASSGFFLPYWLRGTYPPPSSPPAPGPPAAAHPPPPQTPLPRGHHPNLPPHPASTPTPRSTPLNPPDYPTPVFLNSWRRCNYPRLVRRRVVVSRDGSRDAVVSSRPSSSSSSYYDFDDDDDGGGGGGGGGEGGGSFRGRGGAAAISAESLPVARSPLPQRRGGRAGAEAAMVLELVHECGRYSRFLDIPSLWWQAGTVVCGAGSALSLLVAMAGMWALCVRYVLTKGTARLAAALQFGAGVLIGGGVALYPLGWGSREVRQVCGPSASAFRLGDCELYWAFYLTASAGGLTLLCSMLAICAPSSKAEYS